MKTPKTVECKSAPFHLPEELARQVDEVVAGLPNTAEYAPRTKSTAELRETDPTERTDISYISTPSVDADKEIVAADGFDFSVFTKNPVVLLNHDRGSLPVGKSLWVKQDGNNGVLAKTYYPTRPKGFTDAWKPDEVWGLVSAGLLVGKSVGFVPLEFADPTDEQRTKGAELVIKRALLCEYSCVTLPCNTDSLVQAINKGMDLSLLGFKAVGRVKPKTKTVKYVDRTAEFAAAIFNIELDTDAIAKRVLDSIAKRGRV